MTGDDEDNILICQVAKDKYLVDRIIARVNNPRNREWFELLDIKPYVSATDSILRLIEHEVPDYGLVHLLDLPGEKLEIIELQLEEGSPAVGKTVGDLSMPEGSLLISVLRDGEGFVPGPETDLRADDEILAVLDPGLEEDRRRNGVRQLRRRASPPRRRRLDPAGRPRTRPALRATAAVQGISARRGQAREPQRSQRFSS